jgi:hypothetical protein
VEEAISLMEVGNVCEASLDHNLGEGYRLVLWMAENGVWQSEPVTVHSSNPPGAEWMCGVIERDGPYRKIPGARRFVAAE